MSSSVGTRIALSWSSENNVGMTRNVSGGIRKCFRPRYINSSTDRASVSPERSVNPSQRMNELKVTRVGNNVISIPRRPNCLAIGMKPPPGDSSTSF